VVDLASGLAYFTEHIKLSMEQLEVTNFLTIRQAQLDVRRFTILIGPQANGKSVLAKILYFFRDFLSKQFIQSIRNRETKPQLIRQGIASFEQIFPKYAWLDEDFKLIYRTDELEVSLVRQGRSSKRTKLKFDYSQSLSKARSKAKNLYKHKVEELASKDARRSREAEVFWEVIRECIHTAPIGRSFHNSLFIPASRSFFANLQKNVFSFLANNIAIDPLMKEFGSTFESSKRFYERGRLTLRPHDEANDALRREIRDDIEKILVGHYVYEDDQDWIVTSRRKVNVANASSGQQEALPLLLVLSSWLTRSIRPLTFFIEEPEAHLFPVSQRLLIGIFSRLYSAFGQSFLLTTHSPYVLTAINNLLMASNLTAEQGKAIEHKVKKIIGNDEPIRFEDVGAYTIRSGVLESILDDETKLIGSSIIDSVSDEFDSVFDKLMQLQPN
jgi:predicted ATPase